MWGYTPRRLQAWLEIIARDIADEKADMIETAALGNISGTKKGNEELKKIIRKLREST